MKRLIFAFLGFLFVSNISFSQNIHNFNFLSSYSFNEIESNIKYNFDEMEYEIRNDYGGYRVEVKLSEENKYQIIVFEFGEDRYDSNKFVFKRAYCSNTTRQFAESLYNEVRRRYSNQHPSKGYIEERQDKDYNGIPSGKSVRHEIVYDNRIKEGDGVLVRFNNSIFAAGMKVAREYHFEISYSTNSSYLSYCEPHSEFPLFDDWRIVKRF